MKKGKIGELSKTAAETVTDPTPRYLLQGRQESTGNWRPEESSIKSARELLSCWRRPRRHVPSPGGMRPAPV